jgi:hypothetical protein
MLLEAPAVNSCACSLATPRMFSPPFSPPSPLALLLSSDERRGVSMLRNASAAASASACAAAAFIEPRRLPEATSGTSKPPSGPVEPTHMHRQIGESGDGTNHIGCDACHETKHNTTTTIDDEISQSGADRESRPTRLL